MAEPKSLIGLGFDIFEEASTRGHLDKLLDIFRKRHKVIVLGSTGVGKTNFLKSLQETMPEAIDAMTRSQFVSRNKIKLGKEPFEFIDTPGEIGHEGRRVQVIRDAMRGGTTGIINLVAYGYHEYGDVRAADVFTGDENKTVKPEFLEKHRQVEIDALREWNELLGDPKTAKWLMTVVTKVDLWADSNQEVISHYEKGDYYTALGSAQKLHPVVSTYCSVFHKFYGFGRMSGEVDDEERKKLRNHLIHQLIEATLERI